MKLFTFVFLLLLSGCNNSKPMPDLCLEREIFNECLNKIRGPQSTVYNDWDEAIEECRHAAFYLSLRQSHHIKPECREK